jgi:hypothetical protein
MSTTFMKIKKKQRLCTLSRTNTDIRVRAHAHTHTHTHTREDFLCFLNAPTQI